MMRRRWTNIWIVALAAGLLGLAVTVRAGDDTAILRDLSTSFCVQRADSEHGVGERCQRVQAIAATRS